jgi:hypothetical protein
LIVLILLIYGTNTIYCVIYNLQKKLLDKYLIIFAYSAVGKPSTMITILRKHSRKFKTMVIKWVTTKCRNAYHESSQTLEIYFVLFIIWITISRTDSCPVKCASFSSFMSGCPITSTPRWVVRSAATILNFMNSIKLLSNLNGYAYNFKTEWMYWCNNTMLELKIVE